MTEFAAPAAPVLLGFLLRALLGCEAEAVERLTADLAEYHLIKVEIQMEKKKKLSVVKQQKKNRRSCAEQNHEISNKLIELCGKRCATSCLPLLAQSRQTGCGVVGTEVRTLKPPISHTFWTAQSSCWRQGKQQNQEPYLNIPFSSLLNQSNNLGQM